MSNNKWFRPVVPNLPFECTLHAEYTVNRVKSQQRFFSRIKVAYVDKSTADKIWRGGLNNILLLWFVIKNSRENVNATFMLLLLGDNWPQFFSPSIEQKLNVKYSWMKKFAVEISQK